MSLDTMGEPRVDARVLLVDDDPVDRMVCVSCLRRMEDKNYEIVEADSGAAALKALDEQRYDCLLLDQNLPDVTGIELLDQLNTNEQTQGMAVIILTGQDTVEVAAQALRGGAADYLQKKAISTESLGRAIANATEKVQLEQAIFQEREVLALANDQLRAKHREIQNFYHQVSHELRTPLTSLREFVSIVNDGLAEDPEEQAEYLGYAIESCDRLSKLVDDLIDATRLESGKLRLREQWVDASEVFKQLQLTMQTISKEAGVEVRYEAPSELVQMWADPERLLQVLTIFMTNAIKFTAEGGRVSVSAAEHAQDSMVRLAVKDTGCGIADDHLDEVFSRLFQVEEIEHEASTGLGLGLSIAKAIVEQHGGDIGVESELGVGSEFFVCIPTQPSADTGDGSDDGEALYHRAA